MAEYYFNISDKQSLEVIPGVCRKVLKDNLQYTISYMEADPTEVNHEHSHPSEQFFFILSGNGMFRVGDKVFPVKTGDCVVVPGNMVHTFERFYTKVTWLEILVSGRECS